MKRRMTHLEQTRTSILASLALVSSLMVTTPVFSQDHVHSN